MTDRHESELEQRARARFAQSCETLDRVTRRELRQRREAVLASVGERRRSEWRPLAPAGAMATMMAIAGAIWLNPGPSRLPAATAISAEAAQETADETAQALDDDPDFYLWLASEPAASDDSTDEPATAQESEQ